jgi:NAD(P)-dependent dehydrogenase (short-subunit alcohol dehydrogenase family)
MNLELTGQRVLITGGSKGIGLAIAQAFAAEGAKPVLVSRDRANLTHAVQVIEAAHNITPEVFEADLSLPSSADELCKKVGDIDVLINNAGAIPGGSIHDITEARWRQAWELKLYSYINLTRAYLPSMEKRGKGVIANIIGMAGAAPRYEYICGSAANAALIAFTQGLGGGTVRQGVRVFGINPSPTRSDRMQEMLQQQANTKLGDTSRWHELTLGLPFGRLAEPSEMAKLAVFCTSPLCSYLSGSVINVDGGQMFTTPSK